MQKTLKEQIELYRRFKEGTELEEIVFHLVEASSIIYGFGAGNIDAEKEVSDLLSLARSYIDSCLADLHKGFWVDQMTWEEYNEIDPELYSYVLGGLKKYTQEEYEQL
jgi:hypothetical protein